MTEPPGYSDDTWRQPKRWLRSGTRALIDFVVPPVCLACKRALAEQDALCAGCWRQIAFIRRPICDRLGIPLPYDPGGTVISAAAEADPPVYDRARAVASFGGVMRDLIHAFKYGDQHDARRLFGRWLAEAGSDILDGADLIVPVPLGRYRLLSRRFNQAALLAQEVARLKGLTFAPQVLARVKPTTAQVVLTRDERRRNVGAAFAVPQGVAGLVEGKNVVLVDDVITTGATVEACTRALRRAGGARVDVLALALVTDPNATST